MQENVKNADTFKKQSCFGSIGKMTIEEITKTIETGVKHGNQ